jgi:MoaA/NifB/PqqE/SkfB family radical SAM enzyme
MKNRLLYNLQFVLQKPTIIPRLIANYFKLIFLRKNVLKSVAIDLGYNCQLNCKHCYASKMRNSKKSELTIEELKSIVDQSIKLGAVYFWVGGGEPLLYEKKALELVEHINKSNAFCLLSTNGILMKEPVLRKLKAAGLNLIMVSIDYHNGALHDYMRDKGCYDKAMEGIKLARKVGLRVLTSTVVTADKIKSGELERIIKLNNKLGVETHVSPAISIGNWSHEKEMLLSEKDLIILRKILKHNDISTCEEVNYLKEGCSAGTEKFNITGYGDVIPCPYIQLSYGNIREKSLEEIFSKMCQNKYFKNRSKVCLPASNKEFINIYLRKVQKSSQVPLDIKECEK